MINEKTGFSLIEILQTVVLLGIIAGLSISFFRNVNSDTKLRDSTELMLLQAIQEANRQMCNDKTLYCQGVEPTDLVTEYKYIIDSNAMSRCNNDYNGTSYEKGYCVKTVAANANCDAGLETHVKYDGRKECFAPPKCHVLAGNVPSGAELVAPVDGVVYSPANLPPPATAQPMKDILCPASSNYTPVWDAKIQRTIDGTTFNDNAAANQVNEICYRLWDLINHKRQGATSATDLTATCITNAGSAVDACFATNTCAGVNNNITNMILPNGVRLYGLSWLGYTDKPSGAGVSSDGQHIFIKYDRNENVKTYNLDSTTTMFNAVRYGAPNNLSNDNAFLSANAGNHGAYNDTKRTEAQIAAGIFKCSPRLKPMINDNTVCPADP